MRRELKFRAWHKDLNMMSYKAFDLNDWQNWNEPIFFVEDAGTAVADGVIWMQFTGLLDKQGKEIYEGDIINFPYYRKIYALPVKWGTDGWWAKGLGWFKELYWVAEKCEVVGNIYESSELLK